MKPLAYVPMLSKFHADFGSFRIHPALLDVATGAAMFLIPNYDAIGHLYARLVRQHYAIRRATDDLL
jgi:hypothetical protein